MNFRYQRGNSLLIIIVIMLVSCIFLLNSLHSQLDSALATMGDEQRYLRGYNQALSSLHWGLAQKWVASELFRQPAGDRSEIKWYCKLLKQEFKACIKPAKELGVFLMKGESQDRRMAMYQRVKPEQRWVINDSKMIAIDRGMLDFCPEKSETFCH